MAARSSRFQIEFIVDGTGKVRAELAQVAASAKDSAKTANEAGRDWEQFGERIGKSLRTVAGIVGGGLLAGLALVAKNTMDAQQELAQLDAVLKSSGQSASYSRQQLVDMADAIAAASTFSGGEVVKAETRLLSYSGVARENFAEALQVAIDQAARLGISVEQSAEIVGRALESPTKAAAALAQQGFGAAFTKSVRDSIQALEDAGREADAQKIIIDILNESYEGAAQAARDTFGGALAALKNTLNDLTTGADGSLDGATQAVNDLIDTLNDPAVKDGFQNLVSGATNAVGWLAKLMATAGSLTKFMAEQVASTAAGPSLDDTVRMEEEAARIRKRLGHLSQYKSDTVIRPITTGSRDLAIQRDPQASRNVRTVGDEMAWLSNYLKQREAAADSLRELAAAAEAAKKAAEDAASASPAAQPASPSATSKTTRTSRRGSSRASELTDEEKQAQQLQRTYDGLLASYEREIALFGQTGRAAQVNYEIQQGGLKGVGQAQADYLTNLAQTLDAMSDYAAIYESDFLNPMEEATSTTTDRLSAYWDETARNINNALADMIYELDFSLSSLVDSLLRTFANLAASSLLDALGSWGSSNAGRGGWLGSLASGVSRLFGSSTSGRATGGGVNRSRIYQVTEGGRPELLESNGNYYLMPGNDGVVMPATAAAASGASPTAAAPVVNINFKDGTGTGLRGEVTSSSWNGSSLDLQLLVSQAIAIDASRNGLGTRTLQRTLGLSRKGATNG
jgi:Prophage tail length tape measure protein.